MTSERRRERSALLTAVFTGVLAPLNSTMIVVALPDMLADLDAPLLWGSWIIVSYLVAMAAVLPLGGSLGDRYGRRRMLLLALMGFTLASLLAALSWRIEVLVLARTLQAITVASAIPNGVALIRALLPEERHGRAFGLLGAGIGVAAALGPPLGGLISDVLGWRWLFGANLLVLVPGLLLAAGLPRGARARESGRFDSLGAALLLVTLVGAALSATVWRIPAVPAFVPPTLVAVTLAAGSAFVRHARTAAAPVLQLALLRRPGFLAAGMTVATSNLVMYTVFVALPLLLVQLARWDTRDVGWAIGGMSLAMLVCGPLGGALSDRLGRRLPALVGTLVALLGTLPFVFVSPAWPWGAFLAALVVLGVGIGLASAPVQAAAMRAAHPGEEGQAAGLFATMRYAGSIVGTIGLAAVLGDAAEAPDYRLAFTLVVGVALLAVVSAWRLPRDARREPRGDTGVSR